LWNEGGLGGRSYFPTGTRKRGLLEILAALAGSRLERRRGVRKTTLLAKRPPQTRCYSSRGKGVKKKRRKQKGWRKSTAPDRDSQKTTTEKGRKGKAKSRGEKREKQK